MQSSKTEILLEPLCRARDLLRMLAVALRDLSPPDQRIVENAQKASEALVRSANHVQLDASRRAFTREFYRSWATVLEMREVLDDELRLRVFREVEDSMESARRILRRFEEVAASKSRDHRRYPYPG